LEDGQRHIPLGADLLSIIAERLSAALDGKPRGTAVNSLEGREVRWVLSLSELHASFYGTRPPDSLTLFVQNAQGETIGVLSLTEAERQQWLATLTTHQGQAALGDDPLLHVAECLSGEPVSSRQIDEELYGR
jgi:hypothetical protein